MVDCRQYISLHDLSQVEVCYGELIDKDAAGAEKVPDTCGSHMSQPDLEKTGIRKMKLIDVLLVPSARTSLSCPRGW